MMIMKQTLSTPKNSIHLHLPEDLIDQLDDAATQLNWSKSLVVEEALREFLATHLKGEH